MWLWVGFYLASILPAVLTQNTILAPEANLPKKSNCDEVLLKIWRIFTDLIEEDGTTVKAPSRDQTIYALTLIKKSILETEDSERVTDVKERLFLREAELAKYKSIYLYDTRPLQTLLDQQLIPGENSNTYDLNVNNKPECNEVIQKLIKANYDEYNILANSPICTGVPFGIQASQDNSLLGYGNKRPTRNREEMNISPVWNNHVGLVLNQQLQVSEAPNLIAQPDINTVDANAIMHAVNLSKETNKVLATDYATSIEHAKDVADKMNKLYPSSNAYNTYPPLQPMRSNTNFLVTNTGVVNNPTYYSKPDGIQTSSVAQSLFNQQNNIDTDLSQANAYAYSGPTQDMATNIVNQTPTLVVNSQLQTSGFKNIEAQRDIIKPPDNFVNAKWHPNPDHFEVKQEPLSNPLVANNGYVSQNLAAPVKIREYPYQNQMAQNGLKFSENVPVRINVNPQPYIQQTPLIYNPNSLPTPWNYLQSNAYKLGQKPNFVNYNTNQYIPQVSALSSSSALGYNNRIQGQIMTPNIWQNNIKPKLNNPNVFGQKVIQSIPQSGYTLNIHNNPQRFMYSAGYVSAVPNMQQTLNYNNEQSGIDKLANWITGTNSVKLNSDIDSDAEIELMYRVIKPVMYPPPAFYVKFRMPYKQFANHVSELMTMQNSRSATTDTDLYRIASQYNATIIPSDMTGIPEDDLKSPDDKLLVRATYIQPNNLGNDNSNTVDIINLEKEGLNNAFAVNTGNGEANGQNFNQGVA